MGARGEQPDRDAAARVRVLLARPAERLGDLLDVADQVGVERLAARPDLLAGPEQVAPSDLDRVDAGPTRHLVHLELAGPVQVRGTERTV